MAQPAPGALLGAWTCTMRAAGLRPGTIKHHVAVMRRLSLASRTHLLHLSTHDLEAWLAGQGLARNTLRSYRAVLGRFYTWAVSEGHLPTSPATALPRVHPQRAIPHPCPETTWRAALAQVEPRVRLMIRLGVELGLRRAEIASVHRRDLQHTPRGPVLYVVGKGARERVLPLSPGLAVAIQTACEECPAGWAFPSSHPRGGHIGAVWVGKLVGQALGPGATCHSLRHRFATVAYGATNDLLAVQALLGHSKPETTLGYISLAEDRLRIAAAAAVA